MAHCDLNGGSLLHGGGGGGGGLGPLGAGMGSLTITVSPRGVVCATSKKPSPNTPSVRLGLAIWSKDTSLVNCDALSKAPLPLSIGQDWQTIPPGSEMSSLGAPPYAARKCTLLSVCG